MAKKQRIYFDAIEIATGELVVKEKLPYRSDFNRFELYNNGMYEIRCSTCGGKGRIIARRRPSNHEITDYYIQADHADDCLVASNGSIKKLTTGELVLDCFSGVFIEKRELASNAENRKDNGVENISKNSKISYSNGNGFLKKINKAMLDTLRSLNSQESITIREESGRTVSVRIGDLVIDGHGKYFGKDLTGPHIIVGCKIPSKFEDSEEEKTIYLLLPSYQNDYISVAFHFPNGEEWKKFKDKKEQYIKVIKENEVKYQQYKIEKENYDNGVTLVRPSYYEKKLKEIPVISCQLKRCYSLNDGQKAANYQTNISERNYIWIDENEL